MNHNVDTKAILELAEMGNEVKVYLQKQYPDVFAPPIHQSYFIHSIEDILNKTKVALLFCGKSQEASNEIVIQVSERPLKIIKPYCNAKD